MHALLLFASVYAYAGQEKGSIQSTLHARNVEYGCKNATDQKWNHMAICRRRWLDAQTPNRMEELAGSSLQDWGNHLNIKKLSTCTSSVCFNAHSLLSMQIWDVIQICLRSTCVPTLKTKQKFRWYYPGPHISLLVKESDSASTIQFSSAYTVWNDNCIAMIIYDHRLLQTYGNYFEIF